MERIKRFLLDESGTAEATSSIILIAAVGVLLGAGMIAYYAGVNGFFSGAASTYTGYSGEMGPKF